MNVAIPIIYYETAEDIISEVFARREIDSGLPMVGVGIGGFEYRLTYEDAVDACKKKGCYGFVFMKKELHVWIDISVVSLKELVVFFAHEIGHLQHPFRLYKATEEVKAINYEEVAAKAFSLAHRVINGTPCAEIPLSKSELMLMEKCDICGRTVGQLQKAKLNFGLIKSYNETVCRACYDKRKESE